MLVTVDDADESAELARAAFVGVVVGTKNLGSRPNGADVALSAKRGCLESLLPLLTVARAAVRIEFVVALARMVVATAVVATVCWGTVRHVLLNAENLDAIVTYIDGTFGARREVGSGGGFGFGFGDGILYAQFFTR